MTTAVTPTRSVSAAYAGALALVALVAFGLVWLPYYGDQALYSVIGRDIVAGRVPYTGIWDIKQPGVYLWYGLLGGVPWVTRLADVLVLLGTCALFFPLLRGRVSPAVARWAPVVAALVTMLGVRALDLGQVEQLVCLPATASLVLALRRRPAGLVAAGALIGVVAVFKLWLAAVPVAAILVFLLATRDRRAVRDLGIVVAGALVPLAALVGWLAAVGALGTALQTWFVYPAQALGIDGARPVSRLLSGAGRFVLLTAALVLPALAQLPRVWRERDPLDLACVAWLVVGTGVVLTQLWWSYHWLTLVPPLALLAARRVDRIRPRWRPALAVAALPVLAFALLNGPLRHGDGLTAASRAAMTDELSSAPTVRAELAVVGPTGPLYVLGDPTYQLLAEQPVALRLNGWTPELFTADQWASLAADLAATRPRTVLVENVYTDLVATRGGPVAAALHADYDLVRSSTAGDWYRLR